MDRIYESAIERASAHSSGRDAEDVLPEFVSPEALDDLPAGRIFASLREFFYSARNRAASSLINLARELTAGGGGDGSRREESPDGPGRVIQLVSSFGYGDGVGNEIIALDRLLKESGITTGIWAWTADPRLGELGIRPEPYSTGRFRRACRGNDIVLFHHSIYTPLADDLKGLSCRVVLVYHNITPPGCFAPYSAYAAWLCGKGLRQTAALKDVPSRCIAVSEFNRTDLVRLGYRCPVDVIPILIPFEEYGREPSAAVVERMTDGGFTNVLFVGRIAPNKCQEDVIAAFAVYQKRYNSRSRLILAGSGEGCYKKRLLAYAGKLGVKNLIFTGHVPFEDILGYYRTADLFLCMSGHEGFCIPLAEAFVFGIPVIAYDSSAVGETLGDGGILLRKKDPELTASLMDEVLASEEIKERMRRGQRERLEELGERAVKEKYLRWIGEVTDVSAGAADTEFLHEQ